MRFRNPWIDPRVLQLVPEVVQEYLLAKGWENLGPAAVPDLVMFDTPEPRGDKPNVLLPLHLESSPLVQRLIELLTEVALYEDRYAGNLLDDILQLQQQTQEKKLEALRQDIAIGIAQADRGEVAPFDAWETLDQVRKRRSN